MKKIEKSIRKFSNTQTQTKFKKTLLKILLSIAIIILISLPLIIPIITSSVVYSLLKIAFDDPAITSILITIMVSLFAIDVALISITKSRKEEYYLGKKLERNYYYSKINSTIVIWLILYTIPICLCIITSDLKNLTNYSLVLSLIELTKIIVEILSLKKSDAELYYLSNCKNFFMINPFNNVQDQIDKFYEIISDLNNTQKLYSGNYIIVKELNNILSYLITEKDENKRYSYLDLYDILIKKFCETNYYELSIFYYDLLIEKCKIVIDNLIKEKETNLAIKLTDIVFSNYIKLILKINVKYCDNVKTFFSKNYIKKDEYKLEKNIIFIRFNFISLLNDKVKKNITDIFKLYENYYSDNIFIDKLNDLKSSCEKIKIISSKIEKTINEIPTIMQIKGD